MTVVHAEDGTFRVVRGQAVLREGFASSSDAWRWIDRQEGEPISPAEKRTAWFVDGMLRGDL